MSHFEESRVLGDNCALSQHKTALVLHYYAYPLTPLSSLIFCHYIRHCLSITTSSLPNGIRKHYSSYAVRSCFYNTSETLSSLLAVNQNNQGRREKLFSGGGSPRRPLCRGRKPITGVWGGAPTGSKGRAFD